MRIKSIGIVLLMFSLFVNVALAQKKKGKSKATETVEITVNESCTFRETSEKIKVVVAPYKLDRITSSKIH